MTIKSRRRILKGLSLALPATWARPVVEAVVLPAHAQTSTPGSSTSVNCGVPAGCYRYENHSFTWPGGTGPHFSIPFHVDNTDCVGNIFTVDAMVAVSIGEANVAFDGCEVVELEANPAPPGGCSFYFCGLSGLIEV